MLKTVILILIFVVAGYLIYVNFIQEDPCNPPAGVPENWEPPISCIPSEVR
jgi:hypothetical protein